MTVNSGVTLIDLVGTNIVTATTGTVELSAVTDSANVVEFEINAANFFLIPPCIVKKDKKIIYTTGGQVLTANILPGTARRISIPSTLYYRLNMGIDDDHFKTFHSSSATLSKGSIY